MGKSAGTGAHMVELRRTKAGPFDESTLTTLDDLRDAHWYYKHENNEKFLRKILQPIENAVKYLPKVWILDSAIESLSHGVDLAVPGISKLNNFLDNEMVAVLSLKGELVALGTSVMITDKILKLKKGIAIKIDKVFMKSGVYPRPEIE